MYRTAKSRWLICKNRSPGKPCMPRLWSARACPSQHITRAARFAVCFESGARTDKSGTARCAAMSQSEQRRDAPLAVLHSKTLRAQIQGIQIVFGLAVVACFSATAQIQQAWVAKYNNGIPNENHQALKMTLDNAGNIYVLGVSANANTNTGYVVLKYAPNGNQIWTARYDSTNYPNAAQQGFCTGFKQCSCCDRKCDNSEI